MELNQCFLLQMLTKRGKKSDKNSKNVAKKEPDVDARVWLTRNYMSFLIDNLQFYLQADVLETQFVELETKIKQSKDFEQIRMAHDTFLTKIQAQSFILNKTVYNCLNEIMDLCLSFGSLVITNINASQEIPKDKIQDIIKVNFILISKIFYDLKLFFLFYKEFQNQTHVLYATFKALEKRQLGSHLEQLLTRINFNNYLAENDGFIIK